MEGTTNQTQEVEGGKNDKEKRSSSRRISTAKQTLFFYSSPPFLRFSLCLSAPSFLARFFLSLALSLFGLHLPFC